MANRKATSTPGESDVADDPGSERVTLTKAELEAMMARAVAAAVAQVGKPQKAVIPTAPLPTLEEAHAQAEARLMDGAAPVAIETQSGWYAHPMVGTSREQVEAELAMREKRAEIAARRKAQKAKPADDGTEGGAAD